MAPDQKSGRGKKRPSKYFSQNAKRRKDLELRAGLQGFLITCDGGRERLSAREAVQLVDRVYEALWEAKDESSKFKDIDPANEKLDNAEEKCSADCPAEDGETKEEEETNEKDSENGDSSNPKPQGTNIEALLEEEIAELRDNKQARFIRLETGCNGLVFIRMLEDGTKGPNDVVEAILNDCIQSRKHLTRYSLRFIPVLMTCYASAEEVKKMAEPLMSHHFPVCEADKALKFAVVYEARANTSLDRMEIINTVAKLVPPPHSVDLKNPDRTIIVQVVKTICAIGVVSNYKQFAKYNLRQLTSPKQEKPADNE